MLVYVCLKGGGGQGLYRGVGVGKWGEIRGALTGGLKIIEVGRDGGLGSCGTSSFVREGCVCVRQRGLRGPRGLPLSPCQGLGVCRAKKLTTGSLTLRLFRVSLSFILCHQ